MLGVGESPPAVGFLMVGHLPLSLSPVGYSPVGLTPTIVVLVIRLDRLCLNWEIREGTSLVLLLISRQP